MSDAINTLLSDVNLSALSFSNDGRVLTIDFLNMTDGNPCAQLIASGVVVFNYHNTFGSDEDALPAYVGEVTCRELREQDKDAALSRLGYGFLGRGVVTFVPEAGRFQIHVEGGELGIDLICAQYRVSRQTL
jgi:hypothetical protein